MESSSAFPRRPSAPWGRLRAPQMDYLESCGLPSKGDNKLLDFKTQESYYAKLVERYMQFCAAAGRSDDSLAKAFSSLAVASPSQSPGSTHSPQRPGSPSSPDRSAPPMPLPSSPSSSSSSPAPLSPPLLLLLLPPSKELTTLLLSTRKLREGLLASRRHDVFAQRSLVFSTRLAILCRSAENYVPALSTLLHRIHPQTPLPASELAEFASYAILDLACRQRDFHAAFLALRTWKARGVRVDERVGRVVKALVHDDWVGFWRTRGEVDGYVRGVMGFAEDGVRRRALKGVGSAYLSVDKGFVEGVVGGMKWADVKEREGVGWEEEGERIVVRRVRARGKVG